MQISMARRKPYLIVHSKFEKPVNASGNRCDSQYLRLSSLNKLPQIIVMDQIKQSLPKKIATRATGE
jgi:hypothetical protein